ncbi:MAG TPA: PAS domain-containing protein, partial [Burkholderiaceae bacterium]|nr:PAS domain-containing protein [Burkholderiaceae bacterium]
MAKPALHLSRHSPAWLTLGPLALGLLLIAALWLPALLAVVAEQDSGLPGRRREHLFLLSLLATALVVVAIGGFIRWAHRRHDDLQRRLRDITNNIPALIGHFDAQERCQFANDPALRWHGIRREELAQHSLRSALGEENYDHHLPYLRKVLQGETVQFEGKVQRKGADVYYQAHLVPEQLEGPDAPRGFYLMTFDVTALKQAELRQRTSEQRLRGIADNLPVLITCVDR